MPAGIKVSEVMRRNVATILPFESVKNAAEIMAARRVGSIWVLNDNHPVGVITDTDILRDIVASGKNASTTQVRTIMRGPLVATTPDEDIDEAGRKMSKNNLRRLPVLNEEGRLIGVVADKDLVYVYPGIVEILRETVELKEGEERVPRSLPAKAEEFLSVGICDNCGIHRMTLKHNDTGQWTCDQCDPDRTD